MDGKQIQSKVNLGYRLAAARTGLPFQVYRPAGTTAPIVTANLVATLPAAFSADDYRFRRPQGYAKPTWTALIDGAITVPGDYLVEVSPLPGQAARTFFISSQQPLLPIQAIACNAVITVARPTPQSGIGALPLGGNETTVEVASLTGWPASILQGTKGEKSEDNLPDDTRSPWTSVLLPPSAAWADVRTDDVLTDDGGRRYLVSGAELTALGWRLTAAYAGA